MANKKSPAAQAIKDMLELGLDISFFTCNVNRVHELNLLIGIVTKEKKLKKEKKSKHKFYTPIVSPIPKRIILRQSVVINPDGTVAMDSNLEWDWK